MKILIVDDNSHDREALKFFLQGNGFQDVYLATNGTECIEMALDLRPEVIILDVFLKEMTGYGICNSLKSHKELDCKIIMMTGEFHQNDPSAASQAAPDFFLAKTGVYDGILKIIQRLQANT